MRKAFIALILSLCLFSCSLDKPKNISLFCGIPGLDGISIIGDVVIDEVGGFVIKTGETEIRSSLSRCVLLTE